MKPRDIIEHYAFESRDDVTLEATRLNLEKFCPGNYRVVWNELNAVDLIFDNPEEKTLWMLKWM